MKKPLIIAGPCSAESRRQLLDTCLPLAGRVDMLRVGVWKPRSRPGSFEGVGGRALAWVAEAKRLTGLPAVIEGAGARHVHSALKHGIDALWLGARTTVSPFAVQDIADALRGTKVKVFVKNPVNPDLELWSGAVERLAEAGVDDLALIHRGFSSFGRGHYRNAPMWNLAFEMRARYPHLPMICDPSHIAGARGYVAEVAQTAADLRYDGLMIEAHARPEEALSDAAQQLTPRELIDLLDTLQWRGDGDGEFAGRLERLRQEIDRIDSEIFTLLGRRMAVADRIGEEKRDNNVVILQDTRWRTIVEKVGARAAELGLSPEFVHAILDAIHIESINRQNKVLNK
jgi:chorismate mutase